MPANNDYPILDGIAPSWADIVVRLAADGVPILDVKDIKAINTSATVEVGKTMAGGRVMKTTTGSSSYEASLTLYREGYDKLVAALSTAARSAGAVRGSQALMSLVHFGIQIVHTPPGSTAIFERRLKGCRVVGDSVNGAEGTDADEVEVTLDVKEIAHVIEGQETVLL